MSKLPTFQFDPGGYLQNAELMAASDATQAIWMRALCGMHFAKNRGRLKMRDAHLRKLLNVPDAQAWSTFCEELERLGFGYMHRSSDGNVTLVSRRMVEEEKSRRDAGNRMRRLRSKPRQRTPLPKGDQNILQTPRKSARRPLRESRPNGHPDVQRPWSPEQRQYTDEQSDPGFVEQSRVEDPDPRIIDPVRNEDPDRATRSIKQAPEQTKKPKARPRRPETPLPDDFVLTPEMAQFACERWVEPKAEFEKFRDYSLSKDLRFRDWQAAWHKWVRKAMPDGPPGLSSTMPRHGGRNVADLGRQQFGPGVDEEMREQIRRRFGPVSEKMEHQIERQRRFEAKEPAEDEYEAEAARHEAELGQQPVDVRQPMLAGLIDRRPGARGVDRVDDAVEIRDAEGGDSGVVENGGGAADAGSNLRRGVGS
jgi:hypothetical protein